MDEEELIVVKKGDSSFNVVFKDNNYTNKLWARNITLTQREDGVVMNVDFSHYSKRKRGNLEDSDFDSLQKQKDNISHFIIGDGTVSAAVERAKVIEVRLHLSDELYVSVPVTSFDKTSGFLR